MPMSTFLEEVLVAGCGGRRRDSRAHWRDGKRRAGVMCWHFVEGGEGGCGAGSGLGGVSSRR